MAPLKCRTELDFNMQGSGYKPPVCGDFRVSNAHGRVQRSDGPHLPRYSADAEFGDTDITQLDPLPRPRGYFPAAQTGFHGRWRSYSDPETQKSRSGGTVGEVARGTNYFLRFEVESRSFHTGFGAYRRGGNMALQVSKKRPAPGGEEDEGECLVIVDVKVRPGHRPQLRVGREVAVALSLCYGKYRWVTGIDSAAWERRLSEI
ncbi:hypothetical protein B0H16DRAFT_1469620 [Mycena metata]|uniref:Uncharacterized protein n=1 Tax=Mycena metata TaxID=1033252 RepID=A0AAD7HYC1_9AGAR|nr:hypothetical protein B0H16DRAFT_1469620 [Mycena metata]